jgi:hypothetical protein
VTNEGEQVELGSGSPDPQFRNYPAASHVEGKAAVHLRRQESTGGTVYHNNTDGTCPYCHSMLRTLLPEGAILAVVPPPDAKPKTSRWKATPTSYVGNEKDPKPA